MNKVEKMSIGGYAFSLDAEANIRLSEYLRDLETHYAGEEGGREILDGIEERVAELLIERCGASGTVGASDVDYVIYKLGRPERIDSEVNGVGQENASDTQPRRAGVKKKIYRDPSEKKLGGVCKGLANYFNTDPLIFRLGFTAVALVLLFTESEWFLLPVILYFALWICIPQATTVQQRCEMYGEDGTVDDIRRNINSGVKEMGDAVSRHSDLLKVIGRVIAVCAGMLLLLIGICGIVGGAVMVWGQKLFAFNMQEVYSLAPEAFGELNSIFAQGFVRILALLAYFIPFLAMSYAGTMLIFNFRSPSWRPGLVMFLVWFCTIVALSVIIIMDITSGNFPAIHGAMM